MPNTMPLALPTADVTVEPALSTPARTEELLTAVRSLFTCTRKVRGWVSDAASMTVLGIVDELGEAKVSAIAAALLMDVSTVSRTVSSLGRDELVQWRTDPSDGRSHLVSCTRAGQQRLAERRVQMAAELDRRLADWPASEVDELSSLLNRFVASLLAQPALPAVSSPTQPTAKESA